MTCPWEKHIKYFNEKKNKETVENCLQITVELKFILKVTKANLILDEIMLNIPFNFPIPRSFHSFLRAPFFSQLWLKLNFLGKNSLVLDNQTSYSACPKDKWVGKFFSYRIYSNKRPTSN